jgi:hypothetical protein
MDYEISFPEKKKLFYDRSPKTVFHENYGKDSGMITKKDRDKS